MAHLVGQGEQLAFAVALAQHGECAGSQVQVLQVEADQLAAAQGQVEQQADDGPVPDRPFPLLPLQDGEQAANAVLAGAAGVAVALQLLAPYLDRPRDQAEQPGQLDQRAEGGQVVARERPRSRRWLR